MKPTATFGLIVGEGRGLPQRLRDGGEVPRGVIGEAGRLPEGIGTGEGPVEEGSLSAGVGLCRGWEMMGPCASARVQTALRTSSCEGALGDAPDTTSRMTMISSVPLLPAADKNSY